MIGDFSKNFSFNVGEGDSCFTPMGVTWNPVKKDAGLNYRAQIDHSLNEGVCRPKMTFSSLLLFFAQG